MTVDPKEWIPLAEALATIQNLDPDWDAKAIIADALCAGQMGSRSLGGSARTFRPAKETLGPAGEIMPAVWQSVFSQVNSWNRSELNWRAGSCKLNDNFFGQLSFIQIFLRDLEAVIGRTAIADASNRLRAERNNGSAAQPIGPAETVREPKTTLPKVAGSGRPPAHWWPDFAEELAFQIHQYGLPERQAELIAAVQEALVVRGKTEPSRSQIQPVVRAVFARIAAAGN